MHEALRAAAATATPRRTLARLADNLAQADAFLKRAGHDMRVADLTSADLSHLYLGGLRWDESNWWLEQQREQIRTSSDPADGINQIRDH